MTRDFFWGSVMVGTGTLFAIGCFVALIVAMIIDFHCSRNKIEEAMSLLEEGQECDLRYQVVCPCGFSSEYMSKEQANEEWSAHVLEHCS